MPVDDLNRPLGLDLDESRPARDIPWGKVGLAGVGLLGVALGTFVWWTNHGMGGEPFAVARIERQAEPAVAKAPTANDVTGTVALPQRATGAQVEAQSGVVTVRQGNAAAPGALILQVPKDVSLQLTPAPDRRLVERKACGLLPRIGVDGARPSEIYARPYMSSAKVKPGSPRIALVVGGMGLNRAATESASERLPGEVTLGFAPYGMELEKQVAQVREAGHEVILQAPMESFSASETPGPHTLFTTATNDENIEHMRWLMCRFTGYIGGANFLGAKFTAEERAFAPMLREVGARGLAWFDDGTSPRTLAGVLAPAQGVPYAAADVAIDADPRGDAIEAALLKLESLARQNGSAIGFGSGLPASIDRIARFAKSLEGRGVALVPLSVLLKNRPAATAGAQ
jgi:polysaccharide deacetylase 2 family uncharacterized protein YibQ